MPLETRPTSERPFSLPLTVDVPDLQWRGGCNRAVGGTVDGTHAQPSARATCTSST